MFWVLFRFGYTYVLIVLILGSAVFYIAQTSLFRQLVKDIRPYRNLPYQFMILLGIIIALNNHSYILTGKKLFMFIFLPLSLFFGIMYSLITNNVADIDIDRISNSDRPLVTKAVDPVFYEKLKYPFLILSLLFSLFAGFKALFMIVLFTGNYYLYTMAPLRLKRIPFFSKLIISVNSLVMSMTGYYLITGTFKGFPGILIFYFLVIFTFPINFIDLKDYEGDKANNIMTIPVLIGLNRAKFFIGLSFFINYIATYFILKNTYILILLGLTGALQFYLINREHYKEKYVFQTYLISLFAAIVYISIFNIQF